MTEDTTTELTIPQRVDNELAKIDETGAASIRSVYAEFFQGLEEAVAEAKEVQADEPKKARGLRLRLVKLRTGADKARLAANSESKRRVDAVNGMNKILIYALKPVEIAMEEIEKAEERRAAERQSQIEETRLAQLSEFTDTPHLYGYKAATNDEFEIILDTVRAQKAAKDLAARQAAEAAESARIEAEKQAEADRAAREQREAEMAAENEQLRIAAENERVAREEAEARAQAEREAAEEAARIEQEKAAAEQVESDRIVEEVLAKERARSAEIEAKAKAEREAREEVERKAEQAEAERARKAAAAPDREKLHAYVLALLDVKAPKLETDTELQAEVKDAVNRMAKWIASKADKLG